MIQPIQYLIINKEDDDTNVTHRKFSLEMNILNMSK